MNRACKEVCRYWSTGTRKFAYDPEILDDCVDLLDPVERKVLEYGEAYCDSSITLRDTYKFVQERIFRRYDDVCNGFTEIVDDNLYLSSNSSLVELALSPSTLTECYANGIYKIKDFSMKIVANMSLESVADLTAAILLYHSDLETGDAASY